MKIRFSRLLSKRNSAGFTLAEVIISTALLGILVIGILLFMTPVFSMTKVSEMNKRADRAATTIELYLSKSLANASWIKVFTNATDSDFNVGSGDMRMDADMKDSILPMFADTSSAYVANNDLRCIHIKYTEDANIRNSGGDSNGDGKLEKYMIYNDMIDLSGPSISSSTLVFEASFYEDLYPSFTIEPIKTWFDSNGKLIENVDYKEWSLNEATKNLEDSSGNKLMDTSVTPSVPYTVKTETTPGIELGIQMFSDEDMNGMSRVFEGVSYIETINTKGESYAPLGRVFDVTDVGTGKDIYIFYVLRKPGMVASTAP
ncbi:MAG: prepilin-type N-terminal cleavage/methylation domain-containing protein [Oscillospiraceae bacterium]|nr:prepilin-type N-terminal cleavage/methylation domain-containing protein [Oscillospiraceae bacterium]